jgi:adenylosuccinate synthase
LRVGDILSEKFEEKYAYLVKKHCEILKLYDFSYDIKEHENSWFEGIELIRTFQIVDSEYMVNDLLAGGKSFLAEGAQGTLLDIDFGSYPFVTSSNTVCAGACIGLGIPPSAIGEVFGIFKAYCTRVGSGPFPTELDNDTGEKIRTQGAEFGATTGRPRRCGWLDLPALKYSIMLNGITQLFMTKADVMSGFPELKICTTYNVNGELTDKLPYDINSTFLPVYESFTGWDEEISACTQFNNLPPQLKEYITFIEDATKVPITMISVGPDRSQIISRVPGKA